MPAFSSRRPRHRYLVLGVVLLAAFATNLTLTILTIALPFIALDFDADPQTAAWVTVAPMLMAALLVPAAGRASDVYGRKRVWLLGFAVSILGMAVSGWATSLPMLVVARVVTGAGTAVVMPSGLAIAAAAFEPAERGTPVGWWTGTVAISPMLGVLVGGFVVQELSWRWLCYAQLPVAALAWIAAVFIFTERRSPAEGRFDFAGSLLLAAAIFGLLLGVNEGPQWGWSSPAVLGCFGAAAVCFPAFLAVERRVTSPVVPLDLFSDGVLRGALLSRFALNFAYMGGFIVLPFFLREIQGMRPAAVSLALFPRPLAMGIMGPIAGTLAKRVAPEKMGVGGAVLIAAATTLFVTVGGDTAYPVILAGLVTAGIGLGMASASQGTIITARAGEDMLGTVSALLAITLSVASSAGMAVLLAVVSATGGIERDSAYRWSFLAGAGVTLVGIWGAVAVLRRLRSERARLRAGPAESSAPGDTPQAGDRRAGRPSSGPVAWAPLSPTPQGERRGP